MGKWIVVVLVVIGMVWLWRGSAPDPAQLAPSGYRNEGMVLRADSSTINHTKDLKYQSVGNAYTIVNISSDTCPYCRALDPRLEKFMGQRADVQLKVIKLPSPPPECSGGMTSEQFAACEPKFAAIKAEYKRLGVCHTPHIAIYDPKGKPIAEDSCNGRSGLDYVHRWLRESGVS